MRLFIPRVVFLTAASLAALTGFLFLENLRSSESMRMQDAFSFRAIIDQYTLERGRAPVLPVDLVRAGYLKAIPADLHLNDFFGEGQFLADPPMNSPEQ